MTYWTTRKISINRRRKFLWSGFPPWPQFQKEEERFKKAKAATFVLYLEKGYRASNPGSRGPAPIWDGCWEYHDVLLHLTLPSHPSCPGFRVQRQGNEHWGREHPGEASRQNGPKCALSVPGHEAVSLVSPALAALAGGFFTPEPPGKPRRVLHHILIVVLLKFNGCYKRFKEA